MTTPLIIIGGGQLARVLVEAARAQGTWNIIGFVDPLPCRETEERMNVRRLGDDAALFSFPDATLILGVGALTRTPARKNIVSRISANRKWATVIHPFTSVSPTACISSGVVILPGAAICSGVYIDEHVLVDIGAIVNHDVRLGPYAQVGPRVVIGGEVTIGENSFIGMGAVIRDHITIGPGTLVGMGAVVTKNWPAGTTLIGVPARPL